jgi:hypothetical protein
VQGTGAAHTRGRDGSIPSAATMTGVVQQQDSGLSVVHFLARSGPAFDGYQAPRMPVQFRPAVITATAPRMGRDSAKIVG